MRNRVQPGFLAGTVVLMSAVIGLHFLCRVVFYFFNSAQFEVSLSWFSLIIRSFQQDLFVVCLINLPIILLFLISTFLKSKKVLSTIAFVAFCLLNAFSLALNVIDVGYYRFVQQRLTIQVLFFLQDSVPAYKSIVTEFWMLAFLFVLLCFAVYKLGKVFFAEGRFIVEWNQKFVFQFFLLIIASIIGLRGLEKRPLTPYTPLLSLPPKVLPLAQNSFYTFLYSSLRNQDPLPRLTFMNQSLADSIVPTVKWIGDSTQQFQRKNVVLFILESFNSCYLTPNHRYKAKTPFLDSLLGRSRVFNNCFANGFNSAHGIVSLLGSLPTFTESPLFHSPNANLQLQGIGNALKQKGYRTMFFMGAEPDHFGFGKFAKMVGIDSYLSEQDFAGTKAYDGNWGIYDEPFFQFSAKKLAEAQQPFAATIFNISSHFPFTIPPAHKAKFSGLNPFPSQDAVSYVDYSLQHFFATAQGMSWFKNTLFVFASDHFFSPHSKYVYDEINGSRIPFFIYDPALPSRVDVDIVVDQTCVVPTILQLINWNDWYLGFGMPAAMAPKNKTFAVNRFIDGVYQCKSDELVLGYNLAAQRPEYLYQYQKDSVIRTNLVNNPVYTLKKKEMLLYLKAYLQQYSLTLNNRKFSR